MFLYGLPVNFQAILIHPHKKTMKRLRDVLNHLYGHLDSSAALSGSNIDVSHFVILPLSLSSLALYFLKHPV
ncbi:hypothetical protein NQ314_008208 [Rhamnusium bicolor]|uniref:V-type proton ATPase subunit C n=1 Tax=Rhamnusium bicolor TaxID=1586634 RepID=A0AAV8YEC4_9CUCU|nr:hypothetical protein NQ314_008208 [Rhamnusium bicolor]